MRDTAAENVTFRVGQAEDEPGVGDGSADLVTICQALHWCDVWEGRTGGRGSDVLVREQRLGELGLEHRGDNTYQEC